MGKPFDGYPGRRSSPKALCSRLWPLGDLGNCAGTRRASFACGKRFIIHLRSGPGWRIRVASVSSRFDVADLRSCGFYCLSQDSCGISCVSCVVCRLLEEAKRKRLLSRPFFDDDDPLPPSLLLSMVKFDRLC